MLEKFVRDFLVLWTTIDPVGTLAIFAALTGGMSAAARRRVAVKATLYATTILLGAIVVGQALLTAMGIQLVSLQVAGGIILFLFGLKMIFGADFGSGEGQEPGHDVAVFPLAVPSIATPGAIMAVIVLTDNHVHPIQVQAGTSLVLLAVLGITFLFMLASEPILRVIGQNGSAILVRVMGMILAALSIEVVLGALDLLPSGPGGGVPG